MGRRGILTVSIAVASVLALAGCSSTTGGSSGRSAAQGQATQWIRDAASAVSPAPASQVKSSAYENCRSDHGYFVTRSEWRTVAQFSIPGSQQAAATKAIASAFEAQGWKGKTVAGILTLTGPKSARGQIRLETGGGSALDVSAISACYS